jgi:glycerol kinase
LQYQADFFNLPIVRPKIKEITAVGAAYLAGLGVGFWNDIEEIHDHWKLDKEFKVIMDKSKVDHHRKYWEKAVSRSRNWIDAKD